MKINYHKISKLIGKVLFIFIFGSLGALWANYYLLPKLSTIPFFSRSDVLKRFRENVTIINKTEQVILADEVSINEVASQATAATVKIVSVPETSVAGKISTGSISTKSGEGVIVTGDGLIATYREAILEKNAKYKVFISNGSSFDANLAAVDEFSNLAFLKIDGFNLTSVSMANSDDFLAGKKLIAVGSGLSSYQNRYSAGILSNFNKTFNISGLTLSSSGKLEGIFETDFLDQRDFVGSPVVSYTGELAGIVGVVKVDNRDKFFVIPANQVKLAIEKEVRGDLAKRADLGAYYISLNKIDSLMHKIDRQSGALIFSNSGKQGLAVIANSPAERGGLRINDIVTAVGEKIIDLNHPLSNLINEYKSGDEVSLTVIRDGQEIKLTIKL